MLQRELDFKSIQHVDSLSLSLYLCTYILYYIIYTCGHATFFKSIPSPDPFIRREFLGNNGNQDRKSYNQKDPTRSGVHQT